MRLSALRPIPVVLVVLAGCASEDDLPADDDFAVEVEVDPEAPTTAIVRWTSPASGRSWVEYGGSEALGQATPASQDDGPRHAVRVLGLPPESEIHLRAVTEIGGVEYAGRTTATTLGWDDEVPVFELRAWAPDLASDDPYVLCSFFGDRAGLVAIDRAGRVLWSVVEPNHWTFPMASLDSRTATVAELATPFAVGAEPPEIRFRAFDGEDPEPIDTPEAHHAFRALDDGSYAWVAADIRPWYDPEEGAEVQVAGDALRIRDPDGGVRDLFSAWDWAEPEHTFTWYSDYYGDARNWTHANALDWNASRGTWLFSLWNYHAVVEIDGVSGEVLRQYGGEGGTGFAEGSQPFEFQHDPRWTPEGTIMLMSTGEETVSLEYAVDEDEGLLTEVWSAGVGEGLKTSVHGFAVPLANGNRLVNWGEAAVLREVTPDGRTAWEVAIPDGWQVFGSTTPFRSFYPEE